MKRNFPGIRKIFLPLVAIAVTFLIQACAQFAFNLERGVFGLLIRYPVPIKSEDKLTETLGNLRKPGVRYFFHYVRKDHSFRNYFWPGAPGLKTDRVVMTELGRSRSEEKLTPIGSSLTHHIYATLPEDIGTVLKEVKK